MTPEERYLFDLQGYLLIRQVLPEEILRQLNQSVDEMESLADRKAERRGPHRDGWN